MYVNRCKTTGKFLFKRDGMRCLTVLPLNADSYDTAEQARNEGEHFGRQPYVAVTYSSVCYLNDKNQY